MIIHILLILQMTIINIITLNSVTISPTIKYAIPLIHGSNLYLIGNDKVLYSSMLLILKLLILIPLDLLVQ